jgi:hypothetical protein
MQCAAQLGPAAALTLATSPLGAGSAGAALGFITLGMGLSALSSSEASGLASSCTGHGAASLAPCRPARCRSPLGASRQLRPPLVHCPVFLPLLCSSRVPPAPLDCTVAACRASSMVTSL